MLCDSGKWLPLSGPWSPIISEDIISSPVKNALPTQRSSAHSSRARQVTQIRVRGECRAPFPSPRQLSCGEMDPLSPNLSI